MRILLPIFVAIFGPLSNASACTICAGDLQRKSLRQECISAKVVVVGTLQNARPEGQTDLKVERLIKGTDIVAVGAIIPIARYLPGDGRGQSRGVFCFDLVNGKISFVVGRIVGHAAVVDYVQRALSLQADLQLNYFLHFVDHEDPEISADAFLEVARATDGDIARAARKQSPDRFRKLIMDPKTPVERIGLFAFLLACGGDERDAKLLRKMLDDVPSDGLSMRRGLLAGLIVLTPKSGWELTLGMLADGQRSFLDRYAAMGVLEFFHNWRPKETRNEILKGLKSALESGDLADMAAENLRRWQWWELTSTVISQFHRPTHDSPIVQRSILRYAVACPDLNAKRFVDTIRKRDPELIDDVVESLKAEKTDSK